MILLIKKYNYKNGVITDSYRVSKTSGTYEGDYIGYYENGKIRTKEYYEKDRQIHFTRYFENGNINEYYDAKKSEKFNSNGEKIYYIDLTTKKGFILYEKGDKWEGIIDDYSEKPNGYGTYYYINGGKFIGNYNYKDDFYGKGQYFWADGRKYEGNFNNGQINGYGKMTYPDGSIQEGIWENGNLINDYNKTSIASNSNSKQSEFKNSQSKKSQSKNNKIQTKRQCECCSQVFSIKQGWGNYDGDVFQFGDDSFMDQAIELQKKQFEESTGTNLGYHSHIKYCSKTCAYRCGH